MIFAHRYKEGLAGGNFELVISGRPYFSSVYAALGATTIWDDKQMREITLKQLAGAMWMFSYIEL